MSEESSSLPKHIGIIMDGNGRWAKERNLNRSLGHREGLKSAKAIVHEASKMGIPYISLYVFSTENWKRTEAEVSYLMQLLRSYLKKEFQFYLDNQIRVVHSGDSSSLPLDVREDIESISEMTKGFTGLTVNLLINYGGRDEIVRSFRRAMNKGIDSNNLSELDISQNLDQPEIPDLDLVIRTAGEFRLSNFLIWQASYSEFYISDKLWPDFSSVDFKQAIKHYQERVRKFGGYS